MSKNSMAKWFLCVFFFGFFFWGGGGIFTQIYLAHSCPKVYTNYAHIPTEEKNWKIKSKKIPTNHSLKNFETQYKIYLILFISIADELVLDAYNFSTKNTDTAKCYELKHVKT